MVDRALFVWIIYLSEHSRVLSIWYCNLTRKPSAFILHSGVFLRVLYGTCCIVLASLVHRANPLMSDSKGRLNFRPVKALFSIASALPASAETSIVGLMLYSQCRNLPVTNPRGGHNVTKFMAPDEYIKEKYTPSPRLFLCDKVRLSCTLVTFKYHRAVTGKKYGNWCWRTKHETSRSTFRQSSQGGRLSVLLDSTINPKSWIFNRAKYTYNLYCITAE